MAEVISKRSPDPNTQVGCVITTQDHVVLATGYNGIPRGLSHTAERLERPRKYDFFEHAERNAIYNAARRGVGLEGSVVYLPGHPCRDCARALIQVGVHSVVMDSVEVPERWFDSCVDAHNMMSEAGIILFEQGNIDPGVRCAEDWG